MRLLHAEEIQRHSQIVDVWINNADVTIQFADVSRQLSWITLARNQPNFHSPVTKLSQPYCPFIFILPLTFRRVCQLIFLH